MTEHSDMLTRDRCRLFLEENTFRLRSPDYKKKFPIWPGSVGLEIEMLPVFRPEKINGREAIPRLAPLHEGPQASSAVVRTLAAEYGWKLTETEDDHGRPMLLQAFMGEGGNISFEPGGQVEFSSAPYPCLSEAMRSMVDAQVLLDKALAKNGVELVQVGINPWHTVPEIGLQMAKSRYRAMNDYYARISEFGQRMMRQSCTIQVNLDFGPDEDTLARRYLAAQLLSPVMAGSFAYSGVVDNKVSDALGLRSRIWRHTDPTHTGIPGLANIAANPTRKTCVDTYFDFVMNATVVFVTGAGYKMPAPDFTFAKWVDEGFNGLKPTLDDFGVHLSLMFPEVRPRGFLEVRSIDCQSRVFQSVPASFVTGLLYSEKALEKVLDVLLAERESIPNLLVQSQYGLASEQLARLSTKVMEIAIDGFSALPPCFKSENAEKEFTAFYRLFTSVGRTPADDVRDRVKADGTSGISFSSIRALEDRWTHEVR